MTKAKVTSPSVIRSVSDTGITYVENNLGTQPATIQDELVSVGSAYTTLELRVDTVEGLSSAYSGLVSRITQAEADIDALEFTSGIDYDGGAEPGWTAFPSVPTALNTVFANIAAEVITKDATVKTQAIASANSYTDTEIADLVTSIPGMFSIPDNSITSAKLATLSPSPAGTYTAPIITVNLKGQVTRVTNFFADVWANGKIPQYSSGSSRMVAKTRAEIMGTAAEYRFYGYDPTTGDIKLDNYLKYSSSRIGVMLGASLPTTTLDVNGAVRLRGGAVLANNGELQGVTGDIEFRAGETFRILRRFNDLLATVNGAPVTAKRFERVKKWCTSALSISLPATPTENDMVEVLDAIGNSGVAPIVLIGNGATIVEEGGGVPPATSITISDNYAWRQALYTSGVWFVK